MEMHKTEICIANLGQFNFKYETEIKFSLTEIKPLVFAMQSSVLK